MDSELVGGISVSLGASDAQLLADLEAAERLVQQRWNGRVFTATLNAQASAGRAGGVAGGGPQTQADVQRAVTSALVAVARSPSLPALISRIDRLRPTQPIVQQSGRGSGRQEPVAVTWSGAGLPTPRATGGQDPQLKLINEELAKTGEFIDHLGGEIQKLPTATARQQRQAAETRVPSQIERTATDRPTEVAAVDTGALTTQLNQIVSTLGSFNERLAQVLASIPTAATAGRVSATVHPVAAPAGAQGVQPVATTRRQARAEAEAARQAAAREVPVLTDQLIALREAQPTAPPTTGPGPRTPANETPGERAKRERDARDQAYAAAWNASRGGGSQPPPSPAQERRDDAAQRRQSEQSEIRFARAESRRELERATIQRRLEQGQATQEASIQAAGRTPRTTASTLGSFFLGPRKELLEATREQAAAEQELGSATKYRRTFTDEALKLDIKASLSSGKKAQGYKAEAEAIRARPDFRKSLEEEAAAQQKVAAATERVQKLTSGFGTAARNLLSVTAAGAAFGLGLQAASEGFKLISEAAAPAIERMTGFAATTTAYTGQLSDATRAANGNAEAVTALKLASTGLADSTAKSIQPLIQQRATVEAGNKALLDQIESLHVYENLRRSSATAGLTTTTGGLLGTPLGGIPSTAEQVGNLLAQQGGAQRSAQAATRSPFGPPGRFGAQPRPLSQTSAEAAKAAADWATSLEFVNGQMVKGGYAAGQLSQALDETDPRIGQTADAFKAISPAMAAAIRDNNLYAVGITNVDEALKALQAIDIAGTIPAPALLAAGFNRADAAMVRALDHTQQYALKTQLPAQAALQNLAQPLLPVGTGIPGGPNAPGQRGAIELQKELNAYYAQGREELENTYKPAIVAAFGAAAGQAFQSQIDGVTALGTQIAGLQADISNLQVAQQTKEYNYQLFIARRTLSDIGGLTGHNFGAGQSYLGVLEKQNLALSRQGQQLQFNLSQRQINFQQAVAGFQTPGVTPEERTANIAQAKLEAGYAQKQLDIQKQMFGNQVKIVDISNMRQGYDLAKQISLLVSRRAMTIEISVKQQELILAQKRSEQLVEQIGKNLGSVDTIVATGIAHIHDLEAAAGRALTRAEKQAIKLVSTFMGDLATAYTEFFSNPMGMANPTGGNAGSGPANQPDTRASGAILQMHGMGAMYQTPRMHAPGSVYRTQGSTMVSPNDVAGEAGSETVAILRNVRPYRPGGGGALSIGAIFSGPVTVRSNDDIDEITRKVIGALGRKAAQVGLRGVG